VCVISFPGARQPAPAPYRDDDRSPFLSLHREMNRVFDDFFRDFDMRLPMMSGAGSASRTSCSVLWEFTLLVG
jgi:HSP20 family protein